MVLALAALPARAAPASPAGDWLTEDKGGLIHVEPCGAAMCGEIAGVSKWDKNGAPPRDHAGQSECHLTIIRDMRPGEDGRWHGTITDPRDGDRYQAQMWVDATGNLRLRGYIAVPLLGSTEVWAPFHGTRQPDCHFSIS